MVSNSQVRIENAALKAEVLKLQKQLEVEKTKRGKQVLRAEWNRAFAEEEFWDKFMQVCPEYRNKFFDRLHSLYCRRYKGRTAEEWHEYWQRRLERITNYRRQFNAARRKRAACKITAFTRLQASFIQRSSIYTLLQQNKLQGALKCVF